MPIDEVSEESEFDLAEEELEVFSATNSNNSLK